MKFTINAKVFAKIIQSSSTIVNKRNVIPILQHVRLEVSADTLSVETTNLDSKLEHRFGDIISLTDGETTVDVYALSEVLKRLPDADCTLEKVDGNKIVIKCGRSRSTLPTLPTTDWPEFRADKASTFGFSLPQSTLKGYLDNVSFAMGAEETRYMLMGIYVHKHEDKIRFVSTDGHRLSCHDTDIDCSWDFDGIILPRDAVLEVVRKCNDGSVAVNVSQSFATFDFGDMCFTTKLIDATYPDYQRVIPNKQGRSVAQVKASDLAESVLRVAAISSEKVRAIRITSNRESLKLEARAIDNDSESVDIIDVASDWDGFVGVNHRYLSDALSKFDGLINIYVDDNQAPVLIEPEDNKDLAIVVMPMRA